MTMIEAAVIAFVLLVTSSQAVSNWPNDGCVEAKCIMSAAGGLADQKVTGTVRLRQCSSVEPTTIGLHLKGFDKNDAYKLHGFHVHELMDSDQKCRGRSSHYNPLNTSHGGPNDTVRHVGDLGNVEEDDSGRVITIIKDHIVSLMGEYSVLGKALMVHALEDDLGRGTSVVSNTTGNAGPPEACCVVERADEADYLVAQCDMTPSQQGRQPVEGKVYIRQLDYADGGMVTVHVNLTGFDKADRETLHGFHVHQYPDTSDQCQGAGSHYNPSSGSHGGPQANIRHVGDLGNVEEDPDGNIVTVISDRLVTLRGDTTAIGRAIVVHATRDDLGVNVNDSGSITTGNAGSRLGCCVIKLMKIETGAGSSLADNTSLVFTVVLLAVARLRW